MYDIKYIIEVVHMQIDYLILITNNEYYNIVNYLIT